MLYTGVDMQPNQLQWMYELERFGIKPGLGVMAEMMELFGHPEQKWPSVHIAGTNGKGSTAALMASALRAAGYKVGLYTSPHLMKFNERIQVNGVQISDMDLLAIAEEMRGTLKAAGMQATFFEFTTALAFLYFAAQKVDIAVIEVGMGGRLDATNVVTPAVSVITNIGFDHEKFLGNTREKIAIEKGGIIKAGVPVVVGEKKPDILALFRKIADEKQAPFYAVSDNLQITSGQATLTEQHFTIKPMIHPGGIQSTGHLPGNTVREYQIGLLGRHQLDNAAGAWLALRVLQRQGFGMKDADIQKGFRKMVWPGRMQIVSQYPLVIVDGAHNEDGAWVLHDYIKDFPRHDVLVLAVKQGKNPTVMLEKVVPLFKHVVVTEGAYDPWPAEELALLVRRWAGSVEVETDVAVALQRARKILPADGLMVVTGSLYMVGHAIPLDYLG
ncbi:MAG: bifunctional folylpolyglutamate synthase/dihydrofolate synthase [Candidatus Andersenbacteria bacterium]|nr:bifunctional folylpolyglutamate synthase/dihydrofolate synthase [Candidatus Andersenbacteria bacterium]